VLFSGCLSILFALAAYFEVRQLLHMWPVKKNPFLHIDDVIYILTFAGLAWLTSLAPFAWCRASIRRVNKKPNKAPEPTTGTVTPRAPSSTSRASEIASN
jgi:hypothetical protein